MFDISVSISTPLCDDSLPLSVVCTACSVLSWLDVLALSCACAAVIVAASPTSVDGALYGVLSVPAVPRPLVLVASTGVDPKVVLSTALMTSAKPAYWFGLSGGMPLPSRTSDGVCCTA